MTPTEQDKELREAILLEFKNVHRLAPEDYTENCTNVVMQLIADHLQTYTDEIRRDVIGENEPEPDIPRNDYYWRFRNELRSKQRQALNSLATKWGVKL